MTENRTADEATLEGEARGWLVRMDGDLPLNASEYEALRAWMARSPAHRAELTRVAEFWSRANVLTELAVPLQNLAEARRTPGSLTKRKRRSRLGSWFLAAGTFACVMLAVGLWSLIPKKNGNGMYGTTVGQQRSLELEDGSSIEMNTDSELQVQYGNSLRKIRLLRGEAYFTVAPNRLRPFEVYAATGVVRAVGTAFAVSVQNSDIRVTVTKGEVAVTQGEQASLDAGSASPGGVGLTHPHISLKAGQTATIADSTSLRTEDLSSSELRRRLAWHGGYLVFSGQPLREVVSEVNRYSSVTLEIADPNLATLAIGGRFKVGDLDAVCDALQGNFGIEVVRIDDRHIQLKLPSRH